MEKKKNIVKLLKLLEMNYRTELKKDEILFWISMFENSDIKDVKRAVYKHMERSKFFPKFSELKEIIEENDLKIDFDSQFKKDGSINPYHNMIDVKFDKDNEIIDYKSKKMKRIEE